MSEMNEVDKAIVSRHSVRAFLPTPVPPQTVRELLAVAARAPSGTNTQPWRVYVVSGQTRAAIVAAVCAAYDAGAQDAALARQYEEPYPYYPLEWISPYIERRRENGWGLYGLLGIQKGDKAAMHAQHRRNFTFFDAPVGLFFTLDKIMGQGAKMDTAMMMQNFMVAAQARGLATCAQAAWNSYHRLILPLLGAPENETLICGMALGYADPEAKVNTFTTPRIAVDEFTRFLD